MASVYRRGGKWYGRLKNEAGNWTSRTCGGADKATALRWPVACESEARDIRDRRVDPRADRYRTEEAKPIAEHIADFKGMLAAKGNAPLCP